MQYLFNKKQFIIFLLSISFLAFAPKIVLAAEYDLIWSQVSNPSGGSDIPAGVAADSSGIYAVGHDMTLGVNNSQWRIEKRSLTDGALIWSQVSNQSDGHDFAYEVAADSTGIYVVGGDSVPGNYQWRIEKRSLTDGALIWSRTSDPSGYSDIANGVAVDSSGVYVVGHDSVPGNYQWRIEKRQITAYIDCGLRIRNGIQTIFIACEPAGTLTSPLRIRKGATTYGIPLVGTSDSSASAIRINTSSGIKALRKYP